MQATHAGNQAVWKQAFENAVLELDPTHLQPKLEAALTAIEDRLLEVRSDGSADHQELVELEDAKRTIRYLGKFEQET